MSRSVALRHAGVMAALFLASCASTPATKSGGGGGAGGVHYKVGSPYVVNGIRYVPSVDYDYDRIGVASWYGPGFHGEYTANGERYNQEDMTAAHTTLPLPSLVEVTNLENGRKAVVRVNDRGPFVDDRIIDLSHAAAKSLGIDKKGTAKVRVKVLADESRMYAAGQDPLSERKYAVARTQERDAAPATSVRRPSNGPIPGTVFAAARPPVQTVQAVEPVTSAPLSSPTQSGLRPDEMGDMSGNSYSVTPTAPTPLQAPSQAPFAAPAPSYRSGYGQPYGSAPTPGDAPTTISRAPAGSYTAPIQSAPVQAAPLQAPVAAAPVGSGTVQRKETMVWTTGPAGQPLAPDAPASMPASAVPPVAAGGGGRTASPAMGGGTEIPVVPRRAPAAAAPAAATSPVAGGDVYIQVGAFSSQGNAQALVQQLSGYGHAEMSQMQTQAGATLWRVRLGPYRSGPSTDALLDEIRYQGHSGAKLVKP